MPLASGGFGDSTHPGRPGGESGERGSPTERDGREGRQSSPVPMAPPTVAPTLVNQPLSVGGAFSMPYDSFQRSPQQMFGYGGLNASPYSPSAISFSGGRAARSFDPIGGEQLAVFDVGRNAQDFANRGFFGRAFEAIGGRFGAPFIEQRAGFFDPAMGQFRDVGGTTTIEKTSENPIQDAFANMIVRHLGSTVDTATYAPLVGGEEFQYSDVGGLLGLLTDGPQMVPMSEIEARAAAMAGGSDSDLQGDRLTPEVLRMAQQRTPQTRSIPVPLIRLGYS